MSDNVAWLSLSFAIMVVAVLANLCHKIEKLEERLKRLEPAQADEPGMSPDDMPAPASPARRRTPADIV